jgi:hypothetical protein
LLRRGPKTDAGLSSRALARPLRRHDLSLRPPLGFTSCASIIMRMKRWVGMLAFAAFALRVASSAAGSLRLMDTSLRASSKRTFFIPERSYSVRSAA